MLKQIFDLIIAVVSLAALSPVLLIVALVVRSRLGTPVFFCQTRPGLRGEPFVMYKFRTMTDAQDADGNLLPDELRLTPIGRVLRRTSLDELPEIFNVLKGEMSFVGPRPLLMRYLDRYTAKQMRRYEVKPGITGWAQVKGRNAISWEEKFKLDVWYVDHQSFWVDLKILGLTMLSVLKREGINHDGHATMEEFWGDEKQAVP